MADGQVRTFEKQRTPEPASTAPHVAIAQNEVTRMMAREGVHKGGRNKDQGYDFRGIDQILDALPGVLAEAHLNISPRMLSRDVTERKTKSGGALFVVVVSAEYEFQSALDGSTKTVGPFYGEASDTADKATNKAMSAAYKYMATQTFCIPFKGMEDADAETHEVAPQQEADPLIEFKANCLTRIAKCDDPEAVHKLWNKIAAGAGYTAMQAKRPNDAIALRRARDERLRELTGATPVEADEIPF